jgi:predicted metal-binding membrane protein
MAGGMAMSGGRIMSTPWIKMPGQTWLGAAGSFVGMWVVMMAAMMLPSLVPALSSYRHAIREPSVPRLDGLTALAGAGYFLVWAAFGAAVYPIGVLLAAAEMRWPSLTRAAPLATGVVLLLAGCFQLTAWKASQLRRCRNAPARGRSPPPPDARRAWRHGLHLGVHCGLCCSGFMLILLATGVMDLGAMAVVAAAITVERLAPRPERAARAAGVVAIGAGALVLARALGVT